MLKSPVFSFLEQLSPNPRIQQLSEIPTELVACYLILKASCWCYKVISLCANIHGLYKENLNLSLLYLISLQKHTLH